MSFNHCLFIKQKSTGIYFDFYTLCFSVSLTEVLVFCAVQVHNYPIYRHELEEVFLYYNLTVSTLVIGPLYSAGLLRVQSTVEYIYAASEVDYSSDHLFAFSNWQQWDPRRRLFVPTRNVWHMTPQCVDENFGFCSSEYLYPVDLYEAVIQVGATLLDRHEYVDLRQVYFRLVDSVLYNLRPVYEMVSKNNTSEHHTAQRYLYHENGKWRVGAKIGSESVMTGIILELEGSAMRVEYENETEWHWLDFSLFTPEHTRRRAFGRLECRRQLPDGMDCRAAGDGACDNGGTCHTDASGVSSCQCAAGYRGIQCEHRILKCITSFHTPPGASSVFGLAPHYEGSIMTVFCLLDSVSFSVCQNGSWQSTSKKECDIPTASTATTTLATSTKTWILDNNSSDIEHVGEDSAETIAMVIIMLVCVQLGCPFLCYCCVAFCRSDEEQELPADDEPNEQKTEAKKQRTSLQRTCSGFFYVCWWVWLAFVIVYFVQYGYIPLDGSSVFSATVIMAFVCLGVLYCCVFSESFCSREYNYLSELENEEVTAGEQIAEMKAAKPIMTFKVECAHDETKTRTVLKFSRYDYFLSLVFSFLEQCAVLSYVCICTSFNIVSTYNDNYWHNFARKHQACFSNFCAAWNVNVD